MLYYMRWNDSAGKVVRVARMNGVGGCQAFYPGEGDAVYLESVHEVDDPATRIPVDKARIAKDTVLVRLLTGESREALVASLEPHMEHRGEYFCAPRGSDIDWMRTPVVCISNDLVEQTSVAA